MDETAMPELCGKGQFDNYLFPHLLLYLIEKRFTGELVLAQNRVKKAIYFQDGRIIFAHSNEERFRLGELLIHQGKLTKKQLKAAQKMVDNSNTLANVLLRLGYIEKTELLLGAKRQIATVLLSTFQWKEGFYWIYRGRLPKRLPKLPLNAMQLIFNGIFQIKDREWFERQLGSPSVVFELNDNFLTGYRLLSYNEIVDLIVTKIDGNRNLEEIISLMGRENSLLALQVLYALRLLNLLKQKNKAN
ncbi:MAG: DUF4388 domain-containing protein [Candidatus Aminicenantes bacterium]|nr:DUF4388 domain-containing protein [Candidatus Aminicenantes bacterium]